MKDRNTQLNDLIAEGNLLLTSEEVSLPTGLIAMRSIAPAAFSQWAAKIRTFLDSEFSSKEKETFNGLLHPNNTSISTVKTILAYLSSLLEDCSSYKRG